MTRQLLKRTGACHRFFCGCLSLLIFWGLLGGSLSAQILLPEQVETEIKKRMEPVSDPEVIPEKDVNAAIQQLQRNQRGNMGELPEDFQDQSGRRLLIAAVARYETAVEKLRVRGLLISGEAFQGELRNRSFVVENSTGKFPLLLSELRQFRRPENEEGWVFDLQDGDRVEGNPLMGVLVLQLLEGGERMIPLRDLVLIDFLTVP